MDPNDISKKFSLLISAKMLSKIDSPDDFDKIKSDILKEQVILSSVLPLNDYNEYLDKQIKLEGENLIKSIDFKNGPYKIGSTAINEQYNQWMNVYDELTTIDKEKKQHKGFRNHKSYIRTKNRLEKKLKKNELRDIYDIE